MKPKKKDNVRRRAGKCKVCGWPHGPGEDCKEPFGVQRPPAALLAAVREALKKAGYQRDKAACLGSKFPAEMIPVRDVQLTRPEAMEAIIQAQQDLARALDAHAFMVLLVGDSIVAAQCAQALRNAASALLACHGFADPEIDPRFLAAVVQTVLRRVKSHMPDTLATRERVKIIKDASSYTIRVVKDSWPPHDSSKPEDWGAAIANRYLGEES